MSSSRRSRLLILYIWVAACLIQFQSVFAQPDNWQVTSYTTSDGLSSNDVNCIMKDKQGFIWVGTANGLNRFDGYAFTRLQNSDGSSHILSRLKILDILQDRKGVLWIGTSKGLFRFETDRPASEIRHYAYLDRENPFTGYDYPVSMLMEDSGGRLWMSCFDVSTWVNYGLRTFDKNSESFSYERIDSAFNPDPNEQSRAYAISKLEDITGDLWIGTSEGLIHIDKETGYSKKFELSERSHHALDGEITSLGIYNKDTLLVGTRFGRRTFDIRQGTFSNQVRIVDHWNAQNYVFEVDSSGAIWVQESWVLYRIPSEKGLMSPELPEEFWKYPNVENDFNSYNAVFVENPEAVWLGTSGFGLQYIHRREKQFRTIQPVGHWRVEENGNTDARHIQAVQEDEEGRLWLVSREPGVSIYDSSRTVQSWEYVPNLFYFYNSLDSDRYGNHWFTSNQGYVTRFWEGEEGLEYRIYIPRENDPGSLLFWEAYKTMPYTFTGGIINEMVTLKDANGDLWFNTGTGLHEKYIPQRDAFVHLDHRQVDYVNNDTCLEKAIQGEIWIPSVDGLLRLLPPFKEDSNHFLKPASIIAYRNDPDDPSSLPQGTPFNIYRSQASKGETMWVAMLGGGLCRLDFADTGEGPCSRVRFKSYSERDGLCSNHVLGILEDKQGRMWLSTSKGLSRFDPATEVFNTFTRKDGLPTNTFSHARPVMDKEGMMYFPTIDGVLWFDPDSIRTNQNAPPVVLTDIGLFNESLHPGRHQILELPANAARKLRLPYNKNFLSFEYAALNYRNPGENQYQYRLEGLDEDWVYAGNRRFVEYPNLAPGQYTFYVKGSNNDGLWNETGTNLSLAILPPPWLRWYAYLLYLVMVSGLIIWIRNYLMNRARMRDMVRIERLEKEKALELDRVKAGFFANISHEFRTPLTLIQGTLNELGRKNGDPVLDRKHLEVMQRNSNRLLQLINQLLDLSRMQSGQMKLRLEPGDLEASLRVILSSFQSLAERKKILLSYEVPDTGILYDFDRDALEKILVNLLSNAFKFTTEGDMVEVHCLIRPDAEGPSYARWLEMEVKDTGMGIPTEQHERIFERFYQVEQQNYRDEQGSGIGLALVQELVDLCKGKIWVESEPEEGSVFSVLTPLSISKVREAREEIPEEEEAFTSPGANETVQEGRESENSLRVLVVEDNDDMRIFISELLEDQFGVLLAKNGQEGWDLALEYIPDLVISDLMMPVLDGMEMCRKLRGDERTMHIPLVILTAKADRESKLEGLRTGAESFLVKPFDGEELLVRVTKLIEQRALLRNRFRQGFLNGTYLPDEHRDPFLEKFYLKLEAHLSDLGYNISDLAEEVHMSRSQLYRKIHALTGESPNELFRLYRMRKAAELILSQENNLTGIMYEVGFQTPSHFARSFRKYFGVNPSEYRRMQQKAPETRQ